jgi:hypothetical protein
MCPKRLRIKAHFTRKHPFLFLRHTTEMATTEMHAVAPDGPSISPHFISSKRPHLTLLLQDRRQGLFVLPPGRPKHVPRIVDRQTGTRRPCRPPGCMRWGVSAPSNVQVGHCGLPRFQPDGNRNGRSRGEGQGAREGLLPNVRDVLLVLSGEGDVGLGHGNHARVGQADLWRLWRSRRKLDTLYVSAEGGTGQLRMTPAGWSQGESVHQTRGRYFDTAERQGERLKPSKTKGRAETKDNARAFAAACMTSSCAFQSGTCEPW